MSLPTILLIAAAVSLGAMVIAVIISFRSEREARSAIFPIVREEETIRAQRARLNIFIWAAVSALFLGGWLASLQLIRTSAPLVAETDPDQAESEAAVSLPQAEVPAPEAEATLPEAEADQSVILVPAESPTPLAPTNTPAPAATTAAVEPPPPTEPPAPLPTATPPPTQTPLPTATPTPEPTATSTATNTPTPTPFLAALVSNGPRTPAPSGAKMGPIELSAEITEEIEAVNPASTFPDETEVIYAVFPYSGMQDGVDFRVIWYQNGIELWRDESEWQWGDQARFFSFFRDPNEGLYKVELQVNDSVLASKVFEVR